MVTRKWRDHCVPMQPSDVTGWRRLDSQRTAFRTEGDEGEVVWIVTMDYADAPDSPPDRAERVEIVRMPKKNKE